MITTLEKSGEDLSFQFLMKDLADIENLKCNIDMFEKIIDEQFFLTTV